VRVNCRKSAPFNDRFVIMSNTELHNSYKCYDSIPTPPDGARQASDFKQQLANTFSSDNNHLPRSASLDSLVNSSDQNSSLDELSDSDSLCELKNISNDDNKSSDKPRKSDIEELKNVEPPKEPVIKAYLEKSHKYGCDYENCGFKKDSGDKDKIDSFFEEENLQKSFQLPTPTINIKNVRRTSVANLDSIRRMETILEEPIEPKISVKEILARFETMRETAEVKTNPWKALTRTKVDNDRKKLSH
jgi:hypothetical protein